MPRVQVWSPRLELGIEELDQEHQLQLTLADAVAEALEQGHHDLARALAEQLSGYSAAHFRGEEALMEASCYEGIEAHRREHASLEVYMGEIRDLLATGEWGLAQPMVHDLRSAIASHVSSVDRAYGETVRKLE